MNLVPVKVNVCLDRDCGEFRRVVRLVKSVSMIEIPRKGDLLKSGITDPHESGELFEVTSTTFDLSGGGASIYAKGDPDYKLADIDESQQDINPWIQHGWVIECDFTMSNQRDQRPNCFHPA